VDRHRDGVLHPYRSLACRGSHRLARSSLLHRLPASPPLPPAAISAASCTTCPGVLASRTAARAGSGTARPPGAGVLAGRTAGRGDSHRCHQRRCLRARQPSARNTTAAGAREAAVRMASASSARRDVALIVLFAINNPGGLAGILHRLRQTAGQAKPERPTKSKHAHSQERIGCRRTQLPQF